MLFSKCEITCKNDSESQSCTKHLITSSCKEESEKAGLELSIQETKGIWSHHFIANRWVNNGNSDILLFSWAPESLQIMTAAMTLKDAFSVKENL